MIGHTRFGSSSESDLSEVERLLLALTMIATAKSPS